VNIVSAFLMNLDLISNIVIRVISFVFHPQRYAFIQGACFAEPFKGIEGDVSVSILSTSPVIDPGHGRFRSRAIRDPVIIWSLDHYDHDLLFNYRQCERR